MQIMDGLHPFEDKQDSYEKNNRWHASASPPEVALRGLPAQWEDGQYYVFE